MDRHNLAVNLTVYPETPVWAWVQGSGETSRRDDAGIPVLRLGGAQDRATAHGADLSVTFYGYSKADLLATLDRFAGGVEALRQAIVDGRDLDSEIVAAGRVVESFDPAEGSVDPPRDDIPEALFSYMAEGR